MFVDIHSLQRCSRHQRGRFLNDKEFLAAPLRDLNCGCRRYGGFSWGYRQNGWFIMERTFKMETCCLNVSIYNSITGWWWMMDNKSFLQGAQKMCRTSKMPSTSRKAKSENLSALQMPRCLRRMCFCVAPETLALPFKPVWLDEISCFPQPLFTFILPSGKLAYWKWPLIVDLLIPNGYVPSLCKCLPARVYNTSCWSRSSTVNSHPKGQVFFSALGSPGYPVASPQKHFRDQA